MPASGVPACYDAVLQRVDLCAGRYGLHSLGHEAGPVVTQDIVDPARQGLVAVAGHVLTLLGVLNDKKGICRVK